MLLCIIAIFIRAVIDTDIKIDDNRLLNLLIWFLINSLFLITDPF